MSFLEGETAHCEITVFDRQACKMVPVAAGEEIGSQDVILGMTYHNRPQELNNLLGMVVTVLPIRMVFKAGETFADHIKQVDDTRKQGSWARITLALNLRHSYYRFYPEC